MESAVLPDTADTEEPLDVSGNSDEADTSLLRKSIEGGEEDAESTTIDESTLSQVEEEAPAGILDAKSLCH